MRAAPGSDQSQHFATSTVHTDIPDIHCKHRFQAIEEAFPEKIPLLPKDPEAAAAVKEFCEWCALSLSPFLSLSVSRARAHAVQLVHFYTYIDTRDSFACFNTVAMNTDSKSMRNFLHVKSRIASSLLMQEQHRKREASA